MKNSKERKKSTHSAELSGPLAKATAGGSLTEKQREKQHRRQRALRLYSEGWTLEKIADELGWAGPSGVSYALKQARKEVNEAFPIENAAELRQLQYARLEELFRAVWPQAIGETVNGKPVPPELKSMRTALRILDAESKLMGIYDLPPAEGHDDSADHATATEEDWPDAILVIDIDQERYQAAMTQSARNEPISVDDQSPAGYIAPRPDPVHDEPDGEVDEPDIVDSGPPPPVRDPRTVIKLD